MRILFLSRWFPYPPSNGSKLRVYNLLRGLAQYHELTLLSFADEGNVDLNAAELQALCREIHVIPFKPFDPASLRAQLGFFSPVPRSVRDTFSLEMKQFLEQALSRGQHDVIIASEIDMAIYSHYFGRVPALLDELQVGVPYERYSQATSAWSRLRNWLTWVKLRLYLASVLKNFRVCVVASNRERQLLSQAVNGYNSIEVIPNCVDLADYADLQEVPQPNRLIFTGSLSFYANYEAMLWFVGEVYPLIQAQVADVQLSITGNHMDRPLPEANNVNLTGFVEDVRPLIASSWVSVVPLHMGGGTRLKILEAMALQTPVVATSKGAEGLDVQDGKHLLIADTPEAFARQVIRLLKNSELRQQLANEASQLVRQKYNWGVVMPRFLDLVERIAG